jgi:hypothetical protein
MSRVSEYASDITSRDVRNRRLVRALWSGRVQICRSAPSIARPSFLRRRARFGAMRSPAGATVTAPETERSCHKASRRAWSRRPNIASRRSVAEHIGESPLMVDSRAVDRVRHVDADPSLYAGAPPSPHSHRLLLRAPQIGTSMTQATAIERVLSDAEIGQSRQRRRLRATDGIDLAVGIASAWRLTSVAEAHRMIGDRSANRT